MPERCYPHPAEASKRARMEEESRLKNVDLEHHPGRHFWLCRPCGAFHPAEQYPGAGITSDLPAR